MSHPTLHTMRTFEPLANTYPASEKIKHYSTSYIPDRQLICWDGSGYWQKFHFQPDDLRVTLYLIMIAYGRRLLFGSKK